MAVTVNTTAKSKVINQGENYLLKEDGGFLLKEDGGKIILEKSDLEKYDKASNSTVNTTAKS